MDETAGRVFVSNGSSVGTHQNGDPTSGARARTRPVRCAAGSNVSSIGNDHQLQLRPGSTDRRNHVARTCALAVTGIESRLGLRGGTGRRGTEENIILPDDGEDGHVDALHEAGGGSNSTEHGLFTDRGDIRPCF
jgi:hypothetical protein